METQRIAQIQHQQSEVNEQKHESDRISHFRHAHEDRGRRQLADRGGQEQSGRHAVEQSVPGDDAVPPRHLGHWHIRIAALAPLFRQGRFGESVLRSGVCVHSGLQKKHHHEQYGDSGQAARDGTNVISHHVQPRIEWSIRQAINGRAIDQQIEGMHFGIGLTRDVAIKVRLRDAALVKFLHTFAGLLAKLVDRAEVDGLGWTCLGAGRLQTVALAVIAERAFVRMTAHVAASDDAERAGRYAARATVADVSLNINVLELILNNGAGRASLMARGRQAMLAMVAHHEPAVKSRLVQHRVWGSKRAWTIRRRIAR